MHKIIKNQKQKLKNWPKSTEYAVIHGYHKKVPKKKKIIYLNSVMYKSNIVFSPEVWKKFKCHKFLVLLMTGDLMLSFCEKNYPTNIMQ